MKALLVLGLGMILGLPAAAEDLDHERARQAREAEESDVVIAEGELQRASARLQPLLDRVERAKSDLSASKSNLQAQYNRLDEIDRKITAIQRDMDRTDQEIWGGTAFQDTL